MKKILFFAVSCLMIVSCSNEAIDFNNSELIPKKLTYNYGYGGAYEDSLSYNEFGNRILKQENALQDSYIYNGAQQLISYSKAFGIDNNVFINFDYGSGESANEVVSIDAAASFDVDRLDNRVLIEVDNGSLPSNHITEIILKTNNHRLLEQLTDNVSGLNPSFQINFSYDDNNNPILIEVSGYNETSGNYELSYTVEQTFDDKNNFLKNTGHQDIITNYFLRWYAPIIDPINGNNSDLALLMNQFAPNNLLTQTTTNSSGLQSVSNYEYIYNEYDYPISGTRTINDLVRTYTFEYY